ncbi:MAG: hypothetical protein AAB512_05220 [Patescibacteria group bacterium]|mgnify:CR=1 FL=1
MSFFDAYAFPIDAGIFPPAGSFANIGELVTVVVKLLISVAGVLSFIFIIISGIKIVTSGGDSKKLGSAQSTLAYAIIGLAVALLALVIINFVQTYLKSSLVI